MGSQVHATCHCGVDATIRVGGGMESFDTTCYFPCLCERCRAVVQVNLLAKPERCPKCKSTKVTPYDDPSLTEGRIDRSTLGHFSGVVGEWNAHEKLGRKLCLPEETYRCPQCSQMTLRFTNTDMCWD